MLERYELIDRYAVGGAAEIYRARDVETGGLVAIKRLRTDVGFDPDMQAGFLRERQLAELSQHKNLIHAFDHGMASGHDWVALEFVHGKELASVLRRLGRAKRTLPSHLSLYIIREVLDGLAFAYNIEDERGRSLGLVHRDLNPRNVMVGFQGDVRVADFGASHASLIEPVPAECVGSLGYLAPEQLRCEELDARTDVFAAGLVLFECVIGSPAFPVHKGEAKVLKLHERAKIGRLPWGLDNGLKDLIREACALEPDARFESASTMRRAVEEELGGLDDASIKGEIREVMSELYPEDVNKGEL